MNPVGYRPVLPIYLATECDIYRNITNDRISLKTFLCVFTKTNDINIWFDTRDSWSVLDLPSFGQRRFPDTPQWWHDVKITLL